MDKIAFSHATTTALATKTSFNAEHIACFSSGGSFGWITNGNQLEVFNTNNGSRISSWIFGMDTKKKYNTIITAVCECPESPFLVVGTVTDDPHTPGSLVCIFNARTSQVTKVITVPYEVTSLEHISTRSSKQLDLGKRLDNFDGIVAMGTYNGHVYLLDLKLSQHSQTSEKHPGSIIKDDKASRLLQNEQHAVVWLGDASQGEKSKTSDLYISSIKFLKKTNLLAVGLSSGIMELWDLKTFELIFSNFVGEPRRGIMISNFVFQEPENDPKNVCYLWVFYMPTLGSPKSVGQAFLLQMMFQDRSYDSTDGYTYNRFSSAFLRFSHPLCSNLDSRFMAPSKLLSCASLSSGLHDSMETSEDEYCHLEDLMVAVWQETREDGIPRLYLLTFDLNQWYHCQMPSSIDLDHYISMADMLMVHELDELEKHKNVLHVKVEAAVSSENYNITGVLPTVDFELMAITSSGLAFENILNMATQISREIGQCQHVLFDKTSYYEMCFRLRELCNIDTSPMGIAETSEHFSLLSTIIDHGAIGVMVSVVRQLACARFSGVESFLTLEHVVEWSKHKLLSAKKRFNKLIVPLLEQGPAQIDSQSLRSFNKCKSIVHQLVVTLSEVAESPDALSDEAKPHLFTCLSLAMHIEKFMCASIWFLNADPMCFCHGALIGGSLSHQIVDDYKSRRLQICGRKLAIDFIVSGEGQSIQNHFKMFSNSSEYPPSNLETLLGIYLLPGANIRSKHFISLYFLEDLLQGASEATRTNMLSTFASQLKISQSFAQLVRASWYLDHQQFKESYKILHHLAKDGSIHPNFYPNMVRGFLDGKELEFALQASRKFLLPFENEECCCVFLESLAVNGKIGEAYQSLKHHAPNFTDCFAKVMAKYGKGEFLKEVLKTPMLSNERCQTYFETFSTATRANINIELFNDSNLKVKTNKIYQRFRHRQLQMAVEEREAYFKESIEASARSLQKDKPKSNNQSRFAVSKSTYLGTVPKTDLEEVVDETYLQPRHFEPEDLKFLEVPVPNKLHSPKGIPANHPSILSKPRSTSSHSGDSAVSSKQLRFAEPEQNVLHLIKNVSQQLKTQNEIHVDIEEENDEEEDASETTLQEESVGDNMETPLSSMIKETEEVPNEEDASVAYSAAESNVLRDEQTAERELETSKTFERESLEITISSRDEQNADQNFDQVSVCTNEISEVDGIQESEVEEALKRPPLRRSKRSLAPETPTRRSSRLTSLFNGIPTQQETHERPMKRIKFEDANTNSDSFMANSLREARNCDSKENISEPVVCPPLSENGRKTPVKFQAKNKVDAAPTRMSTRSKRPRSEEEEEPEELKTPGKRKRLDENACKTPVKDETNEVPVVSKTPRRRAKNSVCEEVTEVQEKRKSPSRRKKEDVISSSGEEVKEENKQREVLKVETRLLRSLEDEGPLTPAQRAIRMKRIQREQEAAKKAPKPGKSKDSDDKLETPTDQSLPVLQFSDPITCESPRRVVPESDSMQKPSYVFSPPLTRLRQRRKEGEDNKSVERASARKK